MSRPSRLRMAMEAAAAVIAAPFTTPASDRATYHHEQSRHADLRIAREERSKK
ncbi:hypothetical protein ABZ814_22735 [Micromonospora musae]|uniref:hypothetical protein n=1 Tax=Micromonospora musae TaxID=1894970 RepID=UPI0033CD42E3